MSLLIVLVSESAAFAQQNRVIFDNQSGEPALVKLIGPTSRDVEVPTGEKVGVSASAGRYLIKVRYGRPGKYRYSQGEEFEVKETPTTRSQITITLHKVVDGNYETEPISEDEFWQSPRPATPASGQQEKPATPASANEVSIVLAIDKNIWLPLEKRGGAGWDTPHLVVKYRKTSFRGTTAVEVQELDMREEDVKTGKISTKTVALWCEVALPGTEGEFTAFWLDLSGSRNYSGPGEMRVYLKATKDAQKPISNMVRIPIAADEKTMKSFETQFGPAPKKRK